MNAKDIHPAIALGLCGLLTAIVNYLAIDMDVEFLTNGLGVIFGAAVAGYLIFAKNLSIWRAAVIVSGFGVSWVAAFWGAIYLSSEVEILKENLVGTGITVGAIGALVVLVGYCIAYPKFMKLAPILRTLVIGALAGALLIFIESAPIVLFLVWQGLIGVSLGWDKAVFEIASPEMLEN